MGIVRKHNSKNYIDYIIVYKKHFISKHAKTLINFYVVILVFTMKI